VTPVQSAHLRPAEQGLVGAVSPTAIAADLEWFSAHGLRLAGTPAERAGAAYVRDRLVAAGIDCRLEAFDGWVSYGEDPERFGPARVEPDDGGPAIDGKIYAFADSTPPEGVEGRLVWVGTGAPGEYDRLGADVRGAIAVSVLSMDAPHGEPVAVAGARGARGIVIVNWSDRHGAVVHTGTSRGIWGNPTATDDERRIPVVAVAHADGERLRRLAERGGRARLHARTSAVWARSEQPIAEIPGARAEFILVYCHLDTFGAGMTDNTTGVVGLMELARLLHDRREMLERGVRLAWWAGHEMPYNGSTHHLDSHWDTFRDRCVAVLNADSWAIEDTLDRVLTWGFAEAEGFATACADAVIGAPTRYEDFDAREAEQSFWCLGIPSIMTFSIAEGYPDGLSYLGGYWHSEADTIDHVDQPALAQLVGIYAVMCDRLCRADTLPFAYSALAERLEVLLGDLAVNHPGALQWNTLRSAATRLTLAARGFEQAATAGPLADLALIRVARTLNPVVYTVGGPYAQDPSSASDLRRRLPGLQRALDGLAGARDAADGRAARSWAVSVTRERNRTIDALRDAAAALEPYAHR
jgi:peptidase M28-like protein/PA domain-containing protein